MNIKFDNWQKDVIKCKSKRILICKGRQIGGTTTFAKKAADRLVSKAGEEIIVVSITEDQAQLVILMVLSFLEKYYPQFLSKKKQDTTKSKILLKNNSLIISRPVGQTGASVRGFTKDVLWLNESSRLPEFVFEAAKAVLLTTNGDIWMDSTPFGKQGYFYKAYLNKSKIWTVFYKTSEQVVQEREINNGWTKKQKEGALRLLKEEKEDMSELQYGQEYLGLFLEDLQQYFPDELLNKCLVLKRVVECCKDVCLGVDLARMGNDKITYEIIQRISGERFHHVENIVKKKQLTTQTEKDILILNESWKPYKIGIDAGSGSLGVGIYDRFLENPKIKRKIVAMNNRSISLNRDGSDKQRIFKEDMYENMKSMMEKGELLLLNDPEVMMSLRSVQWEFKELKGITRVYIFGKDTHVAEGLIRAAWLAKKERYKNFFITYM